jgi:hypothetical protein
MSFDTTRFTTSWLLPPSILFAQRLLFAAYAFATIFGKYGYEATHHDGDAIGKSFSFFTELTYWGLAFYNLFAALHTGVYWIRGRSLLANWSRVLQEAHSVFYSTIVVFPWLVTSTSFYDFYPLVLLSPTLILASIRVHSLVLATNIAVR